MKEINKNIARNIQNYLDALQMEPQDLASRLGCSTSTVYMWLQGNSTPRMDKFDKMCEVFGCERKDLISDKELTPEEIQQKQITATFELKFKTLNPKKQLLLLAYMEKLKELQDKEE